ncbi:Peptide methionine sulfoxide reductase MsrA [Chlamydiales bacterium SCGC AB-751-O23]|nr:Peptide methionine sulfoxide reductase MsrA [Chlamydiales bacterium SCGC AB-751-O23]
MLKHIKLIFFPILLLFTSLKAQEMPELKKAIFATGCFWCTQSDFDKIEGVLSTTVGYTGGEEENPSYKLVSSGKTQHVEALELIFDPSIVSYSQLLEVFWRSSDPTTNEGQFCDIGKQYRPVIFYLDEEQEKLAQTSKEDLLDKQYFPEILVDILPTKTFYPAEDYHQNYYKKNPLRYKFYRSRCGREKRLKEIWKNKK